MAGRGRGGRGTTLEQFLSAMKEKMPPPAASEESGGDIGGGGDAPSASALPVSIFKSTTIEISIVVRCDF